MSCCFIGCCTDSIEEGLKLDGSDGDKNTRHRCCKDALVWSSEIHIIKLVGTWNVPVEMSKNEAVVLNKYYDTWVRSLNC